MNNTYLTANNKPAAGHAIVERTTNSYARTRNGAWIGAGAKTERFEIPLAVLNSPDGVCWLNPGHNSVFVTLPDGSFLHLCGANTPLQRSGFGACGYITRENTYGNPERVGINQPHPLLPNIAPHYYGVSFLPDEVLATFAEHDFSAA